MQMRRRFHITSVFRERLYTLAVIAFGTSPVVLVILVLFYL
jgi:hypothetical protein